MQKLISIELLRICIMFFIVVHHCIVSGLGLNQLMHTNEYILSNNTIILSIINCFVIVAVNIFFLISGYFNIRFNILKCLRIIAEVTFYSALIYFTMIMMGVISITLGGAKIWAFID